MSDHAIYAPSSAHRWINCTASATAIAHLPEQEEGEEAKEGTSAHEEIERCLGVYNNDDDVGGGALIPGDSINPDHPAAYGVSLLLDYVRQLPPGRLWIEQRVELTPHIWGRCDVAHYDEAGETLTIVDYKNGYVDVQAEENEQLMIYAAASIYTHNLPARHVRLVVVQPNSFMPVPRVKQWVTSSDALYQFATRIAAIPAGPLTFAAGEHCRYCPLFGRCEPTRDLLAQLSVALQHTPDEVPPANRAIFKALEKPVSDWFKSADKAWTKDALTKGAPDGMKIVQTQKHRAYKPGVEDAVRALIVEKCGVQALELPTPAQAEKLGVDVTPYTERPNGGPALAFASDKRPEWRAKSAAEMFKGVAG